MTKVISATPYLTILPGATITVTTGDYAGESGLVVSIFRGMATVARDNDRWFTVPISDCETSEAAGKSGLDTTINGV